MKSCFLADFTINSEARGCDRLGGRNHQLTLVAFLSFLAVGRQCGRNHQLTLMALRLFRERDNATSVSWWIIPRSLPGPAKEKKATSVSLVITQIRLIYGWSSSEIDTAGEFKTLVTWHQSATD